MPAGAQARFLVDEFEAFRFDPGERLRKVRDTVGQVVECGSPSLEETPHGGVRCKGLQKLDGANELDPYPLGLQLLDGGTGIPAQEFEERASLFQRGDSDTYMV